MTVSQQQYQQQQQQLMTGSPPTSIHPFIHLCHITFLLLVYNIDLVVLQHLVLFTYLTLECQCTAAVGIDTQQFHRLQYTT